MNDQELIDEVRRLEAGTGSKQGIPYDQLSQKSFLYNEGFKYLLESWSNSSYSKIQSPCINQLQNSVSGTGENYLCATDSSIYDMVGNLHEWVSDSSGTFRGGYYVDTYRNGQGCFYATTAHSRNHWDYSTGFRCCKDF